MYMNFETKAYRACMKAFIFSEHKFHCKYYSI